MTRRAVRWCLEPGQGNTSARPQGGLSHQNTPKTTTSTVSAQSYSCVLAGTQLGRAKRGRDHPCSVGSMMSLPTAIPDLRGGPAVQRNLGSEAGPLAAAGAGHPPEPLTSCPSASSSTSRHTRNHRTTEVKGTRRVYGFDGTEPSGHLLRRNKAA